MGRTRRAYLRLTKDSRLDVTSDDLIGTPEIRSAFAPQRE